MTATEDFTLKLVHHLETPFEANGVLVDRVVYTFDPFSPDDDGMPYESLDFKGKVLTKDGTPRKGGGDYHFAFRVPDEVTTEWLATMRATLANRLANAMNSLVALPPITT